MIDLAKVPHHSDGFVIKEIGDELIFVSDNGTDLHNINNVGSFIWKAIDGKRSIDEILYMLCDNYDVDKNIAEDDLSQFISELAEKRLLIL